MLAKNADRQRKKNLIDLSFLFYSRQIKYLNYSINDVRKRKLNRTSDTLKKNKEIRSNQLILLIITNKKLSYKYLLL